MTPKEKARELVRQFWDLGNMDIVKSKVCALIAVDEIIKVLVELSEGKFTFIHNVEYWQEVKQEIEKL
jgi:hypothetical protein